MSFKVVSSVLLVRKVFDGKQLTWILVLLVLQMQMPRLVMIIYDANKKKLKTLLRTLDKRTKACKACRQVKPEMLFLIF